MTFNWVPFLEDHNISYVTEGSNVARNHVNIRCPICGDSDPSEHMGLSLTTAYWGCWRNKRHRGRQPQQLIMRLLNCSFENADDIVAGTRELSSFSQLAEKFKMALAPSQQETEPRAALEFPREHRLLRSVGLGRHYVRYMVNRRGFSLDDIPLLRKQYRLRYCAHGRDKGRIIFPIYFGGALVCWTGRTISHHAKVRYLSLSDKDSDAPRPRALMSIKDLIWNYDTLRRSRPNILVLTEGPFDALKVDFYGQEYGVRATCLFGVGITERQKEIVYEIGRRAACVVVLPDVGAMANAMAIQSELISLRPRILSLPKHVEDPGALTRHQVRVLFRNLIEPK